MLVLVLAVRLVFVDDDPATAPVTAPPSAAPAAAGATCEGGGDSPTPPLSGAAHGWELVGKVYAPTDPRIGPARVEQATGRTGWASRCAPATRRARPVRCSPPPGSWRH